MTVSPTSVNANGLFKLPLTLIIRISVINYLTVR